MLFGETPTHRAKRPDSQSISNQSTHLKGLVIQPTDASLSREACTEKRKISGTPLFTEDASCGRASWATLFLGLDCFSFFLCYWGAFLFLSPSSKTTTTEDGDGGGS